MPNKNFPMNISNLKLRLVRILFGERIQDVPHLSKEVGHQLVHICINATESNFCGWFVLFSNKNITRYKWKYP